ncbi:MAG: tetratricopeptide repeat protein [Candidatus Caldatribacterium sp.]|uniref:tetratricopeptide repeat protein n=1 Tax=Candidatus Caldatribacterium sp. TaxID=2282143 RepID=UPI002999DD01|nr:tetratricopeptide repeat protein [Candidatus Caldatribacterium sp.]MCX7730514.1 tetratricopeptide repeat protein [Candidatus Caldatribacterium sp.]MDW8081826.1 tetratricopeptide repeat protein [Candidatus Calescibacterium sp.]
MRYAVLFMVLVALSWVSLAWADGETPLLVPYSTDVPAEGYAQVMFDQGYNLYQAGRKTEAIQFFIEAVTTKPDFTKAWFWLARTYQEEDMYDEAIWAWEKVLQLEPQNEQARYFLKKVKNWKEYGKDAWENYERGIVALEKEEIYDAVEYFKRSIEANPRFDKAYYWLGVANLRSGDYYNAVWALEKYLALRPDDPNGQYWLREARSRLPKTK